jgi:hypothetical protein
MQRSTQAPFDVTLSSVTCFQIGEGMESLCCKPVLGKLEKIIWQ